VAGALLAAFAGLCGGAKEVVGERRADAASEVFES
jgi:hypothetical protein